MLRDIRANERFCVNSILVDPLVYNSRASYVDEVLSKEAPAKTFNDTDSLKVFCSENRFEILASLDNEVQEDDDSDNISQYTETSEGRYRARYKENVNYTCPRVTFGIGGQTYLTLVDCGASISTVSEAMLRNLPSRCIHRIGSVKPFNVTLSIEDGKSHQLSQFADLKILLNNKPIMWRFFTVCNASNKFAFGCDVLNTYKALIDCDLWEVSYRRNLDNERIVKSKTIVSPSSMSSSPGNPRFSPSMSISQPSTSNVSKPISKASIKIEPSSVKTELELSSFKLEKPDSDLNKRDKARKKDVDPEYLPVYLRQHVELQPQACCRVNVFTKPKFTAPVMIAANRKFVKQNLAPVAHNIIEFRDGKGRTFVMNPTKKPIKLVRGKCIGQLQIISDYDIVGQLPETEETLMSMHNIELNQQSLDFTENSRITIPDEINQIELGDHLSQKQKNDLKSLLGKYRHCFAFEPHELGEADCVQHVIDTGDHPPICQKPFRVSYFERVEINKQIQGFLDQGIIVPSISPWASPVVLAKKKDGTLRFCVDYRRVNQISRADYYPLPRMDDIFDRLEGSKYFTSMDLLQGYHHVKIHPDSQEKTAFVVPDGKFEWKRLPFGLKTAPSTFQRMMDFVLRSLKWTIALVYLDDIITHSKTFEEHLVRIELVLQALEIAKLTLKPSKCKFAENKLKILGHIVSENGIEVDPEKVEAVKYYPIPRTKKDVRSFTAFCSYYRRFIKNFSKIARPLYALTEDNCRFFWSEEAQAAFDDLIQRLVTAPVMAHFDPQAKTELHTDASLEGLGGIVMQYQPPPGLENPEKQKLVKRVIAYWSKSLEKSEKNYSVTELECLAMKKAIEKFRPYLYGKKFTLVTDHEPLAKFVSIKDPHGRVARWIFKLQQYDFDIIHQSGKKLGHVDALSRYPVKKSTDNKEPLVLNQMNLFQFDQYNSYYDKLNLPNLIVLQREDPGYKKIILELLADEDEINEFKPVAQLNSGYDYKLIDGVLYKANTDPIGRLWKLCIPKGLRERIMKEVHDEPSGGHFGFYKTWHTVRERYHWPNMYKHVRKYVMSCRVCQLYNRRTTKVSGPMCPVLPPDQPFHKLHIDFIGPFHRTRRGNTYILNIIDHLTRFVEGIPVKAQNSENAMEALEKNVIYRYGCPVVITTDRGSPLMSDEFKNFAAKKGIKLKRTSAYHPQANGVVERVNDTAKRIYAKYVNEKQTNWDDLVPAANFAINSTVHSVTKFSPFYLLYGREPILPCDAKLTPDLSRVDDEDPVEQMTRAARAREQARKNTIKFQNAQKEKFDLEHPIHEFHVGDQVKYLNYSRKKGETRKFLKKWKGPFKIVEKTSPTNYRIAEIIKEALLDLRASKTKPREPIEKIVNVTQIRHFHSPYKSNFDSEEEEEVDEVPHDSELVEVYEDSEPEVTPLSSISSASSKGPVTRKQLKIKQRILTPVVENKKTPISKSEEESESESNNSETEFPRPRVISQHNSPVSDSNESEVESLHESENDVLVESQENEFRSEFEGSESESSSSELNNTVIERVEPESEPVPTTSSSISVSLQSKSNESNSSSKSEKSTSSKSVIPVKSSVKTKSTRSKVTKTSRGKEDTTSTYFNQTRSGRTSKPPDKLGINMGACIEKLVSSNAELAKLLVRF